MRRTLPAFLVLLAACAGGASSGGDAAGAPAPAAAMPADPNDILVGTWQFVYEADGAPRQFTLVISSTGPDTYAATTTGDTPMGFRIRRISRAGNGMIMDASTDADLVTVRMQGNNQVMRGGFTIGRQTMQAVMTRVP